MTKISQLRLTGLLALATVIAAPAAFAQDSTPPTDQADQAQTAQSQTATPAEPGKKTWADLDVNKDGKLDKTEAAPIPSLEAVFDVADTNADGLLTGEEYKNYLAMNGDGKARPQK